MIQIENIKKSYGKLEVLQDINLAIEGNKIFSILGPNGSGKTTLIKSILGLAIPDQGAITVNGHPVKKQWEYRKDIDYMPQIARFPENLKVRELIAMVKDLRRQPSKDDELIDYFGLRPFMDKPLRNLSGGTHQKVNVLLGFLFDNPIIILDEPTVGLDPVAMIRLKDLIMEKRKQGKTIILTTHIMSLVEELADEIIFLLEGHIYFRGSLRELNQQTRENNLERSIASILTKKNMNNPSKGTENKKFLNNNVIC